MGSTALHSETVVPYSGFARIYDRVLGDATFPAVRRSFECCVKKHGIGFRSVADIGCGTGTFLRYLGRYGIPLVGVDSSPAMLGRAASKCKGLNIKLFCQNITKLRLPHPVDLITSNNDTFNYLVTVPALRHTLDRCHEHLTAQGHLLFDMITGRGDRPDGVDIVQELRMPDALSVWLIQSDPAHGLSRTEIHTWFRAKGKALRQEREVHVQRWYPVQAVCRLVREAGFEVEGVLDMNDCRPATGRTTWVKYIARKRLKIT
jgi:SAM-dependent methyltransferase